MNPDESGASVPTKYVQVEMVERFVVKLTGEDAERDGFDVDDVSHWADLVDRSLNLDGDYDIEEVGSPDEFWSPEAVDADAPTRLLWQAREHLSRAYGKLGRARYREGHCPEVDAFTADLLRLDERLRLMALEVDEERRAGRTGVIHRREQPALTAP